MSKQDVFEKSARFCPECGKEFYVLYVPNWTYKDKDTVVCSWGCLCSRRKKREEKKKTTYKRRGIYGY